MAHTTKIIRVIGALLLTIISLSASADEPSKGNKPGDDFITRATEAIQAVQARAKADPILRPLSDKKLKSGESYSGQRDVKGFRDKRRYVTLDVQTPEVFDLPTKGARTPTAPGRGRLHIIAYESPPEILGYVPYVVLPPGCFSHLTDLSVPGTQARIYVYTLTSDLQAQQRLVRLLVEELAKVGITAVAPKDDMAAHPTPPVGSPSAVVPPPKTNTGQPPEEDFLAKAAGAFKAVQARVKADAILRPLAEAKVETRGSASLWNDGRPMFALYEVKGKVVAFSAETPEVFELPNKVAKGPVPGHGRLAITIYENLPGSAAILCPFMPPPGCYLGRTHLSVPGTPAKVLVDTLTSDRGAHRRLVEMTIEELAKVGVTAKAKVGENPENVDSVGDPLPQPPSNGAQPGTLQPTPLQPTSPPGA